MNELKELDPNAKCKIYIQRYQSLNTPRVEVLHGVKIKNVVKVLNRRTRRTVVGLSLAIKNKMNQRWNYVKINHEAWANPVS
jgi:hypothetical protein